MAATGSVIGDSPSDPHSSNDLPTFVINTTIATFYNATTHSCICTTTCICSPLSLPDDHYDDADEHGHQAELVILFPFMVLMMGSGAEMLVHKTSVPYTSFLLIIGGIVGYLMKNNALGLLGVSGEYMGNMDAHLLLYTFLPPLIFESAFNVNETHFQKVKAAALTYAGPGLLICTGCTAGIILVLYPTWQWYEAALLGALLSATDPVAVVALLKQVGTGSLLDTLIEAESLLNDGTGEPKRE